MRLAKLPIFFGFLLFVKMPYSVKNCAQSFKALKAVSLEKEYPGEGCYAESNLTIEVLTIFFKIAAIFDSTSNVYFSFISLTPLQALTFVASCKSLYHLRFTIFRLIEFTKPLTNEIVRRLGPNIFKEIKPLSLSFKPQKFFNDFTDSSALDTYRYTKKNVDGLLAEIANFSEALSNLSFLSAKGLRLRGVNVPTPSIFTNAYYLALSKCNVSNLDLPPNVKALKLKACNGDDIGETNVKDLIINARFEELKSLILINMGDVFYHLASSPSENKFFKPSEDFKEQVEYYKEGEEEVSEELEGPKPIFPPELLKTRLGNLEGFIITHEGLNINLPPTLLFLEKLKRAVLGKCYIVDHQLKNLRNVRCLELNETTLLQGKITTHLASFKNLESLRLIKIEGVDALPPLENLKKLRIQKSSISVVSGLFPRLKKLVMEKTKVTEVSDLPSLEKLFVCSCDKFEGIGELPSLLELRICHSKKVKGLAASDAPLLEKLALTNTSSVHYSDMKPSEKDIKLSGFKLLEYLDVRYSLVSDISDMPLLVRLKAGYSALRSISNLPSLKRACVQYSLFQVSLHKHLLDQTDKSHLRGVRVYDSSGKVKKAKAKPKGKVKAVGRPTTSSTSTDTSEGESPTPVRRAIGKGIGKSKAKRRPPSSDSESSDLEEEE